MSKYKTGDRFIIEIKELSGSESIYMIEGLNAVVLEHDLDKLTQALSYENCPECFLKKKAYDKGAEEAWEIAKKLFADFSNIELDEIFGKGWSFPKLMELKPQEAKAKIESWEKASEEIQVGDEVEILYNGKRFYVSQIDSDDQDYPYNGFNEKLEIFHDWAKNQLKKTGRHIDIQSVLNQIGGIE